MKNTSCIRCGKQRIEGKSRTEKVFGSLVTYTQNICPDPECQKIVENELQKKRDNLASLQHHSLVYRKTAKETNKKK